MPRTTNAIKSGLCAFLVIYLQEQALHTLLPEAFFAREGALPEPDAALGLALLTKESANRKHDAVSDFLDWVLQENLSVLDAAGHRVVPAQLASPSLSLAYKHQYPKIPITLILKLLDASPRRATVID